MHMVTNMLKLKGQVMVQFDISYCHIENLDEHIDTISNRQAVNVFKKIYR